MVKSLFAIWNHFMLLMGSVVFNGLLPDLFEVVSYRYLSIRLQPNWITVIMIVEYDSSLCYNFCCTVYDGVCWNNRHGRLIGQKQMTATKLCHRLGPMAFRFDRMVGKG